MKSKRHNYEYDFDTNSTTAPAHVVRMVGHNKRILEVGCGPGSITKVLSKQNNCQVTGLEQDTDAIRLVRPYCKKIVQADLNSDDWTSLFDDVERFDVVVAADVLEHLYDPWRTLQRISRLINPHGYLVISLPHVGHAAVVACLVNSDFEYRDWGLLDRTHIRFFGLKNIEQLFFHAKLKIIEVKYVRKPPEETEFAPGWSKLPAALQEALMSCDCADIYQVVIKAVPFDYAGNTVPLTPPKIPPRQRFIPNFFSAKSRLGQCMNPQLKIFIRRGFNLLGIKL